ncbi:MAG: undecaprenyldiphospho-muramoylpentapeptide beta-N-acetylglucosaminyltransferase [Spirochaetales bacterium]|nr:undecaprenyldiphospho-muramoylpentapeptide beta-N-acetylglucosaminyltransferase [Spirochaetales bacterium]
MKTVVFTGGGTGGHVFPGISVIRALPQPVRSRVVWIGSRRGIERSIIRRAGIEYRAVPAGKLRRYFDVENLLDTFRVIAGVLAAWRLLGELRACLVFSKGGFVAVPVVVAARLRGIPVLIHESDNDPGLATRITAPLAERIMVPYADSVRAFPHRVRGRIVVTGNPVRRAFFEADRGSALSSVGIVESSLPVVLVTGGSLGARQINLLVRDIVERVTSYAVVVHQTGDADVAMVSEITRRAHPGRYHGASRFDASFPALLRRADVVVARAGAGTIWEIAVCGRASVLIPLSAGSSRGDQLRNAERYRRAGAAIVPEDPDLEADTLEAAIRSLIRDDERRRDMERAAYQWPIRNAAERIAGEIAVRLPSEAVLCGMEEP